MNWSRLITWGGGVFEMITRSIFYLEKQWKIEIQFEFIRNLFDFSLWNHNSNLGDIHSVLHITVYSCRNENLMGYFQGQFEVFGLNFFRKTLLDFFFETLESFNSSFCRKNNVFWCFSDFIGRVENENLTGEFPRPVWGRLIGVLDWFFKKHCLICFLKG